MNEENVSVSFDYVMAIYAPEFERQFGTEDYNKLRVKWSETMPMKWCNMKDVQSALHYFLTNEQIEKIKIE